MDKPAISICFPAYNEEENIAAVVEETLHVLQQYCNEFEIIVVNDGSHDRTAEIVRSLEQRDSHVRGIHHRVNRGYGAALRSGFSTAKFQHIFFMDSDRQFDISEISGFLPFLDRYDIVTGYRRERRDPFMRKMNAYGWKIVNRLLFGIRVRDINCAFKCINKRVFETFQLTTDSAMINAELYARAKKAGFSIYEIPVSHYPRKAGQQTGANVAVIVRAFQELNRIRHELSAEEL